MTIDRGVMLALAERVEAALGANRALDAEIMAVRFVRGQRNIGEQIGEGADDWMPIKTDVWIDPVTDKWVSTHPRDFTASLDAAMSLVLKDWNLTLRGVNDSWHCALNPTSAGPIREVFSFSATPALALTAACLRARATS